MGLPSSLAGYSRPRRDKSASATKTDDKSSSNPCLATHAVWIASLMRLEKHSSSSRSVGVGGVEEKSCNCQMLG